MRRTLLLAALVAGPLVLLAGCDATSPDALDGAGANAAAKSDVCHYDADADAYHLINVADAALPAHLGHGDALPGEAVPTMEGHTFDEACQPDGSVDTTPPTCTVEPVPGPPQQVVVTIEDGASGLAEVLVTRSQNADTVVPPFTVGTTTPVIVNSTQIDTSVASEIEVRVTDLAGNLDTCTATIPVL